MFTVGITCDFLRGQFKSPSKTSMHGIISVIFNVKVPENIARRNAGSIELLGEAPAGSGGHGFYRRYRTGPPTRTLSFVVGLEVHR